MAFPCGAQKIGFAPRFASVQQQRAPSARARLPEKARKESIQWREQSYWPMQTGSSRASQKRRHNDRNLQIWNEQVVCGIDDGSKSMMRGPCDERRPVESERAINESEKIIAKRQIQSRPDQKRYGNKEPCQKTPHDRQGGVAAGKSALLMPIGWNWRECRKKHCEIKESCSNAVNCERGRPASDDRKQSQ